MQQYDDVIQQQFDRQFIEKVDDQSKSNGPVHYIPHHPIIKKDHTTTKLRIVYDASARLSPSVPSLNDSLYSGPNLISDLIKLLLQFRSHGIVLLADIEKAFLQVSLREADRDATRIMWLRDVTKPPTDDNIQIWRFRRVPFGATSSPFHLAATIRHHLQSCPSDAAEKMKGQFYVDNLICGAHSVHDAHKFYIDAKKVMDAAGMNLREWVCNMPEVLQYIPKVDRAKDTHVTVLGLLWSVPDDVIMLKGVQEMANNSQPTKRQILKTIAKVFDPLGIVAPVVVTAKVFIQTLWKQNIGWDKSPSKELVAEWFQLNFQALVSNIRLLKYRRLHINSSTQLHVFADASAKAYGAVAYVRTITSNGTTQQLVSCKSRVAPVKPTSTPRLELLAAVEACKLTTFVQQTFPVISSVCLWSDSQVVLHWINNLPVKQGTFVTNRVRLIQSYGFQFRYCPTADNPADLPSRGKTTVDLINSSLWWNGPNWLGEDETAWPTIGINQHHPAETAVPPTNVNVVSVAARQPPFGIKPSNISSFPKLLRVTSYCLRFINRCRRMVSTSGAVTSNEQAAALNMWITYVQHQRFQPQLSALKSGKPEQLVRQLRLFLDNGILKCHGRFKCCNIDANNDVILLPKNCDITYLIISDYHHNLLHQGTRHTLSALRQSWWVPQGRQHVRQGLKRCLVCKYWEGPSYSLPHPPALPSERISKAPAFSYTGCDFAGPPYTIDGPATSKSYLCLFTCAVTRAIHLELVNDMTTECFLMALKRFIARRGSPQIIISDNAKTFKLAQSAIQRIWLGVINSPDTTDYIASHGITWKFNVQRAPWWGGFFERLVGMVKRTILKSIGRARLSFVAMVTLLAEVEAILNARPLTYVHDDLNGGHPLCPANFISDATNFGVSTPEATADPDFTDDQSSAPQLVQRFRKRQRMLDRFWSTWSKEYLSALRERHHQSKVVKQNPYCPQVGDVVLIKEDGVKRAQWKLAVVTYLYHSKDDGIARAAQLRTATQSLIQRPISLLYPLEVKTMTPVNEIQTASSPTQRPRRQAAIRARTNIRQLSAETNTT